MQDFKALTVWQRSHELTLGVYRASKAFPVEERYGLTAQLRRAAVSVPSNIAEGAGRNGSADFARFLSIAAGSASEVEYQVLLARDLNYLAKEDYQTLTGLVGETKRMLGAFIRRLQES